jgi:outer membrane protein TolC
MHFELISHRLIRWLMAIAVGGAPFVARAQWPVDAKCHPIRTRASNSNSSSAAPSLTPLRTAGRKKATLPRPGQITQAAWQFPDDRAGTVEENSSRPGDYSTEADSDPLAGVLSQTATAIDLISALQLAGEQNPTILLGQQRVVEAVALRQLAAAQFLPTINLGTSVDSHWGVLQQSTGNILSVRREAVFVGAGANAIAAGTVNIPGVLWTLNVSDSIFNYLVKRQEVDRREFDNRATRQDVLLRVALAYNDLVRSEGARSIAILSRNDARELARITAAYLATGQGRKPDADRAATEQARREALLLEAEGNVVRASATLCQTLHLDPSLRLHAADNRVIPRSIVPEPITLPEMLAIALMYRPELNERRVSVEQSLLTLQGAKLLPFSPTVFLGFGAGGFGGGSDLVAQPVTSLPFGRGAPRFSSLDDREDLDVMAYWTLQNLGVGNKSMIAAARSRVSSADFELLLTLDRIRSEVAAAQARTFARFARIRSCELAINAGLEAFAEDMTRIRGILGLPLEAIDSLRLLAQSRIDYLDAILDYNQAQFELYVALGKPPSELLIRPAELPDQTQHRPLELDIVGRPSQVGRAQGRSTAQFNGSGRPEKVANILQPRKQQRLLACCAKTCCLLPPNSA